MQFSNTIYSATFFLFILASNKLVASAPLPYHNISSGGIDKPEGEQVGESAPKVPVGAVPECDVPNVTMLPTCLSNPAVGECTEWVQKAATECVKFICPSNEDKSTCITMLQIALESKPQTELAQCYEAKVKEVCPIKVPTAALNGRSTVIPDPKQAITHEVEYPKTASPKLPSADIPTVPTAGDAPYVETSGNELKLPDIKGPQTEVPYSTTVDGAANKLPAVRLL